MPDLFEMPEEDATAYCDIFSYYSPYAELVL